MSALRFEGVIHARAEARCTREGRWLVSAAIAQQGGGVLVSAIKRYGDTHADAMAANALAARLTPGAHVIVHAAGFTVGHANGHHLLQLVGVDMIEFLYAAPRARRARIVLADAHRRYARDMLAEVGA